MTLNLSAQCYLRAFSDHLAIDGGFAHREALVGCSLDYSLGSLDRIDAFVGSTLAGHPTIGECLAGDRATQNTAFLLAFYAGEVLARALRCVPLWSSGEPPGAAPDRLPVALRGMRGALLCQLASPAAASACYAPLASLLDQLYSATAPGLGAAARACLGSVASRTLPSLQLPVAPAADWPLGLAGERPAVSADALLALRPEVPIWASSDSTEPLNQLFAQTDRLLLRGRVVWGALVQANHLLFEPEFRLGAPGEVIYDPQGRSEPEALEAVARLLMRCKRDDAAGGDDPALQRYGEHLRNERTRLFGFGLAGRLLPYPLLASTTYFDQCQLPDGMLSRSHFPLLVDDDAPGLVLPLPAALWPEALREAWLDLGEQRVGCRFDPRAARQQLVSEFERKRTDPAPIFLEGLRHFRGDGVPRNYQRARELWEQAAVCGGGHAQALNNLGVIYEQGLGVAVDVARQFEYYSAAAMHGLALGQLNLGRWHIARGDVNAALPYLRQAAAGGEADAQDLLRQIAGERPRETPASGLLGRLTSLFRR
jgi:hypothetical protein